MTLLEYVSSLQDQGLSQDEILSKTQDWKNKNKQEGEVVISETVELDEVDLGTVKKKDGVPGAVAPSMGPQEAPQPATEFGLEDTFSELPKTETELPKLEKLTFEAYEKLPIEEKKKLSYGQRQKFFRERVKRKKEQAKTWEEKFSLNVASPDIKDLSNEQYIDLTEKAQKELIKEKDLTKDYTISDAEIKTRASKIFQEKILPISYTDELTFVEKTFGVNPFTDFLGDIIRAGEQGLVQSDIIDPTFDLMNSKGDVSDEEILKYIEANKSIAERAKTSDEMRSFNEIYEQNGGGVLGFIKGVVENPTVVPAIFVSSMASQLGAVLKSEEVAAAAAAGAGVGAAAGSIIPGIGTATGAASGLFAGGAATMEAAMTFSELLQEEVGEDLSVSNIRSLLQDEDKVSNLMNKAAARGVTIGVIEGLTGGLAKGVGAKLAKKAISKPVVGAAVTSVEAVGGGVGEIGGRIAAGQEMDVAEIGFEAIAGTTTAPVSTALALANINEKVTKLNINKELKQTEFEKASQAFNPEFKTTGFEIKASQIPGSLQVIDTEVDIDLRRGDITQEQADGVKLRAREVQGATNQLKPLGISIENQPAIVDLMIEQKNLKNTIKQVDNASLTKAESARLSEIDTELGDLITKDKSEKIDVGAKKIAEEIGVGFEAFDTQEDVDSAIATLQEEGGEIDTKNSDNYGTFVVLPDGRRIIVLNKEVATEDRVFTEGQHETAHAIAYETVKNKPEAAIALGQSLLNELRTNKDINIKPEFQQRLDQYIEDADVSEADTMEEVMTLTSEGLSNGTIEINETIGVKLGNFIRRALSAMGMKVKFKNGKDVLNFIKDYNRSVHRQQGLSRGLKKTAIEGAEVSMTPETVAETEVKESVAKESKKDTGAIASTKVQEIYDAQGVAGAFDIIEQFKPIVKKIVDKRQDAPNFDRQLLTDEIETGKRGILDLIRDYKPGSGVPLAAFINTQLNNRAIEASKRVLGEEFTTDVTEARGVVAEETTEVKTKEKPLAKKPTETVEFSQAQIEKIGAKDKAEIETKITESTNKAFEGKKITRFGETRNIPKAVADIYANMFGLNPQTITDKTRNYQKTDAEGLTTAKQFLLKNANNDFARLPKTKDGFGKGTFLPRNVMNALYTDGKLTGTLKDYMDLIRQNPVKPIYRDAVGQTTRGLLNLHIRNRMFEDLVTTTPERLRGGAKFSKRIQESLPNTTQSQVQNIGKAISGLGDPKIVSRFTNSIDDFIDAIAVDDYNVEAAFNEVYGAEFLTKKNGDPTAKKTNLINEWIKVRQSGKGLKDFVKQTPSKITMRDYLYQAFEEQTESEVVENILGIKKGGVNFRSKDQIMGYVNLMNNYIASKYGKLSDKEIAEFVINELGPTLSAGAKVAGNDYMWQLDPNTSLLRLVPSTLKRSNSIRTSVFGNQKQMSEVLIKPFLSEAGKNKLTYKDNTPLWEEKPLKKGQVSQKVSTYTTSIKKNGEISKGLLDKSADFAQQKIETIVDFLNWYKSQGKNTEITVDMLGMAFRAFNGDMTALVRAAARVDSFAGDGTGPQRYEHNPPARTMLVRMAEYVNGNITEQELRDYFSNYTVSIIPELMDDVINERYKDTSPLIGSRYYNAFTYGRFPFAMTKYTKQKDGSYNKTVIGEYQEAAYKAATKASKRMNELMPSEIKYSKTISVKMGVDALAKSDKALNNARRPDAPVKKIRVFDFDDTLARSKSKVLYTVPNVEGGFSEGATKLKAIFMVGGPGAGKTNVGKGLQLGRRGYKVVNQDIALEAMKAESGLPAKESDYTAEQRSLRSKLGAAARKAAVAKFDKYTAAGNGMVIDGTGASYNATTKKIKALQDQGFEVHMVVATTPLETAIERNKARVERSLPDFVVKKTYESVQESLKRYREDFGDRLYEINTETIEYGKPLPNDFLQQVYAGINANKVGKVDATSFAENYDVLEEQGAEFDFREFSKVIDGEKGPLFSVAEKIAAARGTDDVFILTARPADAAKPIQEFMKANGVDIPLANITGLGDGTAEAKAGWIMGKAAEGYNDFYFADDAIKNVKAVKGVLSQVDVKSKVQQAKASKRIVFDKVFNDIIEQKTGIESYKQFSAAKAKTVGSSKGKFTFFTTPSAEDFLGLLYKTLGKGKVGDAQMAFYKENLLDPFNRAEMAISQAKVAAGRDYKALKKQFKSIPKTLEKETGIAKYTYQHAIRTYIWDSQGLEVPGLSKRDQKRLTDFIKVDPELQAFADQLVTIQKGKPYPKPDKDWTAGNITTDVISGINKVNRAEYLQEWQENVDIIFSEKNMNKLEAAFGAKYVEALKDSLRAMKSGSNRPLGGDRVSDGILDWLNNSVGAIMFLNTRSAVLQTISAVNFINWGDNNILKAGKAFANQKQFWGDFLTLMNSDYLLERRDGLKINVSESEIADAVEGSKNKVNAAISFLLNKGFVFTRYADSFAIASGGATFYRNRIEALVEQGMDRKLAEQQAFEDFRLIAEENQQSSSPMRISQQQRSLIGRIILQFGNTQLQYVRIQKRAVQDLVNKRGDWKSNVSKIVYYGAIQNLIFNAMQSGLAWALFDDDEEDEKLTEENKEQKLERALNGAIDSQLKGLGIQGAVVAGVKNALITIAKEADKKSPKFEEALDDLLSIAPALGSKIRKLKSAARTVSWNRKEIKEKGFSMDNPAYLAGAQVISAVLNIPLDRAVMKMNNMRNILNPATENWQKVALALGWSGWDVGLPYFGLAEDKPVLTETEKQSIKLFDLNKSDQVKMLLDLGLTKKEIRALTKEEDRVKEIIKLQNKKKDGK